jgi:hypothetical protein
MVAMAYRLNAFQVCIRNDEGQLAAVTEAPAPQRVGTYPTLDAAMKAAAAVEELGVPTLIVGPHLGEAQRWYYNPATRQMGRESRCGVWLFGIKKVAAPSPKEVAAAAEATKAARKADALAKGKAIYEQKRAAYLAKRAAEAEAAEDRAEAAAQEAHEALHAVAEDAALPL